MGGAGPREHGACEWGRWWSRGDALANHLGQILTRAGCVDVDITDPQSIDKALRIAVTDPAALGRTRRVAADGEGPPVREQHPGPSLGLARSIRYLTDRLAADPITAEGVAECRRQVTMADELITDAKDLPELQHPDAEILGLLARYMEARSRVLALV